MIKEASSQINNITQQRIQQAISQGSKEIQRVLPKILRGAIEDVYRSNFVFIIIICTILLKKKSNNNHQS